MGVLLGLDLGSKRIGAALTDESGSIAMPFRVIEYRSRRDLAEQLRLWIREFNVTELVVGLPKTLKGEMGPAAKNVAGQAEFLKTQIEIPVTLWDERLSTCEVDRVLEEAEVTGSRRKDIRDRLAAQRILQNYLDFRKSGG